MPVWIPELCERVVWTLLDARSRSACARKFRLEVMLQKLVKV